MSENEQDGSFALSITSSFIRERNALFAMADFGELYADYYLHRKDHRIELSARSDDLLKIGLAAFSLHCVSHPRNEVLAWTINLQDPLMNLFLGGDTTTGDVVGRVYTDNVKEAEENVLYQEIVRGGQPLHRSVVPFEGADLLVAAEQFYSRSEQRPARFFRLEPEVYAIVSAHPDYDEEWFNALTVDDVRVFNVTEEVNPLETRSVKWHCGCDQLKILKTLRPHFLQDADDLFLNEEMIEVNCPRCAGKYRVTREMMDAFIQATEE